MLARLLSGVILVVLNLGCAVMEAPTVTQRPVTVLAFGAPEWAAKQGMFPVQITVDGVLVGEITEPWVSGSICDGGRGRLLVPIPPGLHRWNAVGHRFGYWFRDDDVIPSGECAPRHLLCSNC